MELCVWCFFFFFQAEDGIRDLVRSRGLGDVYKRQAMGTRHDFLELLVMTISAVLSDCDTIEDVAAWSRCLLYTSDAADERSSVDLGGRRFI